MKHHTLSRCGIGSLRSGACAAAAIALLLGGAACGSRESYGSRAVARARGLIKERKADEAIVVLEEALGRRGCRAERGTLFNELLLAYLEAENPGSAFARFKEAARREPQLASSVAGTIEQFYWNRWQYKRIAYWCRMERDLALGDQALAVVADWHLRALLSAKQPEAIADEFRAYLPKIGSDERLLWVLDRIAQPMLKDKHYAALQAAAEAIAAPGRSPAWDAAVAMVKARALVGQEQWAAAADFVRGRLPELQDPAGAQMLGFLCEQALGANQAGVVDALCAAVLTGVKDRPRTIEAAAFAWIRSAALAGQSRETLRRFAALDAQGLPAGVRLEALERGYLSVLERGGKDDWTALVEYGRALGAAVTDDKGRERLAAIVMDASFYAERFDVALEVLEKGVPGHDAEWHGTMISKLKAHYALQQGRKRDAATHFREFMGHIAKKSEDQYDPISGTRVTTDMILGLNAKRIGDILASIDDRAGATQAYAEARGYYEKAKAGFLKDSAEFKKVEDDLKAIPAAP
jgi:hypothetical protein